MLTIPVPSSNRQAIILAATTLFLLPTIIIALPGVGGIHLPENYLPIHTFLELFAVAVAVMVTGIGWNATRGDHSGHMIVLGTGFLAVAMLDIGHTLSYAGMPPLVTPSGVEKAIYFWLAARFASAVTLLTVTLAPPVWHAAQGLRRAAIFSTFAFTAFVYFIVLFHQSALPRTFIEGSGLTDLKIVIEYLICGFYAFGAILVWRRPITGSAFRGPVLLAALLLLVGSELAFTLYASASDAFNLLGHLYKVAATYLIYRAVFVDAVASPYIQLAASEKKYREILEQAADAIIRVNAGGRVIDANRRALELFAETGILGHQIATFVDDWESASKELSASGTALWETKLSRPEGSLVALEISARRLDTGEIQAIIRDVTERKQQEERLREAIEHAELANRAKSQFLANMSHELRTPLNAILGFSEIILKESYGPVGDPHYKDYADDIHKSGKHLFSIITDLLDIARIESGQVKLNESDFDLDEAIGDCLRIIGPNAQHLTLTSQPMRGAVTIRADQRLFRQILLNLLSNAVKFTPAGGTIEVSGQMTANGDVAIVVSDTGIGISPADLPRIANAFVQVETAYSRKHQGVGLGLAIARALAELHGGSLGIESEPGQGTKVTVLLPKSRLAAPSLAALA